MHISVLLTCAYKNYKVQERTQGLLYPLPFHLSAFLKLHPPKKLIIKSKTNIFMGFPFQSSFTP